MSRKCIGISSCFVFVAFTVVISLFYAFQPEYYPPHLEYIFSDRNHILPTLTVFDRTQYEDYEVKKYTCNLFKITGFKSPSLESLALATTASEEEEFRLNALAVYFDVTNTCERLYDVSKANIQVYKVALVTLPNETACPLEDLAVSAQNAGYSVLISFGDIVHSPTYAAADEDKLVIPVLTANLKWQKTNEQDAKPDVLWSTHPLLVADRANVEIRVHMQPSTAQELNQMGKYLSKLYYWFLVGPAITLLWLMCKVFWISNGQQGVTNQAVRSETRTMELGRNEELHSDVEAIVENHHGRDEEEQPLLITQNSIVWAATHGRFVRMPRGGQSVRMPRCSSSIFFSFFYFLVASIGLSIAPLPVGISFGGLSLFRFDEGNEGGSYLEKFPVSRGFTFPPKDSVWWPAFQIFCFVMYSVVACKNTWTVRTNFSKLIRSDWFASYIYLLVLGIVLPYCSSSVITPSELRRPFLLYFVTYNTTCTVCNALFVLVLNKHKRVTRYVFYFSICMICAYIQSDIVAVFYFALNSQQFLNNLKLTALRTLAIGLTLTSSFSSSMHIIRKLVKPRESLFEALSEK